MDFLVKGFGIGFLVAAPVGPIGILCIKRSLVKGRRAGLLTGLGAATADAIYGGVAAFGLTIISDYLLSYRNILQLIGVFFLLYLGVRSFSMRSHEDSWEVGRRGDELRDYISILFLTLTNPTTILSFLAIFAGMGALPGDRVEAFSLVGGVFWGSVSWWLILSFIASRVGRRMEGNRLNLINRGSGIFLIFFGGFFLYNLLV